VSGQLHVAVAVKVQVHVHDQVHVEALACRSIAAIRNLAK
jgi:hypothetical protein